MPRPAGDGRAQKGAGERRWRVSSLGDETHASTEGALVPLVFIGSGEAPAALDCLSLRHSSNCVCSGKHAFAKRGGLGEVEIAVSSMQAAV